MDKIGILSVVSISSDRAATIDRRDTMSQSRLLDNLGAVKILI